MAAELIIALRDPPAAAALPRVIAPIRPTLKPTYPLTPIETFITWTRPDGLPMEWTGLTLPSTGNYVIPNGLSP